MENLSLSWIRYLSESNVIIKGFARGGARRVLIRRGEDDETETGVVHFDCGGRNHKPRNLKCPLEAE